MSKEKITWELVEVDTDQLKPNENNPKVRNAAGMKRLRKSVERFGLVFDGICNRDFSIIDGHSRSELAAGKTARVFIPSRQLTKNEQLELNAIYDAAKAGEVDTQLIEKTFGAEFIEEWDINSGKKKRHNDDGFQMPTDLIETDIVRGDLFEIGPHRLLCGDSTLPEDVDRLMNGELADMVFTDPPYGVNVKGGKGKGNTISGDLTQTAIPFSFELCITRATSNKARFYFCGGEGNIGLYFKLFERYLAQMPKLIIWVKENFVMRANGYHGQYELIFFGFKSGGGGMDHWFGLRVEDEASDVWQVRRDSSSTYEHPTQKPVALPGRAIRNSCEPTGLIYEPFSGSASTMVAANQLGRRCFSMELAPEYCHVGVSRMIKLDQTLKIKRNGKQLSESDHQKFLQYLKK